MDPKKGRMKGCPCCTSWKERGSVVSVINKEEETPQRQVFTLGHDEEDGDEADEAKAMDVWVGGGKIWALTPPRKSNMRPSIPGLKEIDVSGMHICPGFVDIHQHVTGGGGEAGFGSRTPEATQTDEIDAGVTTFVSTLGTDTVSRGMENLIAKTRSLVSGSGMTGLAWLGGYSFPIDNTVTGSVRRDVMLIPEIIGVGELAVSDHRGSFPSTDELTRLVSDVRVAGMLSGKSGTTYFHLGEEKTALQPLKDVVEQNSVLLKHIVPTHMERSPELVEQGMKWMRSGGMTDFSGWPERQRPAIQKYLQVSDGLDIIRKNLSISSDSYGSINEFDEHGNLIRYSYGLPNTLLRTFLALVYEDGLSIDAALRFFCRNPASVIRLDDAPMYKGRIIVGGDADLLVLKLPPKPLPEDYPHTKSFGMDWPSTEGLIQYVIAGGCVLKCPS